MQTLMAFMSHSDVVIGFCDSWVRRAISVLRKGGDNQIGKEMQRNEKHEGLLPHLCRVMCELVNKSHFLFRLAFNRSLDCLI